MYEIHYVSIAYYGTYYNQKDTKTQRASRNQYAKVNA